MGVSIHYWAIPPASTLYRRLQSEKTFAVLMAALFPYGCGIFYFFDELESEEREEVLEWVVENREDALGPEPMARRWIDEFHQELAQTRLAYPGIERRGTSLEKTSQLVEERLLRELRHIRGETTAGFVQRLMFGNQQLGRNLGLSGEDTLGLLTAPLVHEGAEVLQKLDAEALFARDGGWEEYHLDDYLRWRQLFRDAASNGDALLVGVC